MHHQSFQKKERCFTCGNYRDLKLQKHVMKILGHIPNIMICKQVSINNMRFGFMPGRYTTDATFIVRQLQEKY